MKKINSECLVLNADYTPLTIVSWQRAIIWNIKHNNKKYAIDIIDFFKNDFIQGSGDKKHPIPAVVKTKNYLNIGLCNVTFSRKNIFIRDNFTCQYCGSKKDTKNLTYDHVIPKSKWDYNNGKTPTNWTNIVTSCLSCNSKKGNRTPYGANMKLLNSPYRPQKNLKYLPLRSYLLRMRDRIPTEWILYLPQHYLED